ncbi:DNA-binding NarL/FixJ family response regulator [Saccharopolyspora erythraea NRRL 2338]|uniref:Transcriptional regulator, LuxR family n=2 Tax=Saccharopolyspora erythraea TaxID=1836 RepID=A4FCW4_SACEN|nr:DNA-binding NarL/FixJ family response regulator [Saccharopolyspora erythraea NRRL 2338]QRK93518.1 response regulator transcription factor [Saccharopolyspora erythraea]CAM01889.1 transcriptional regulator, LuxR family [Saccharopolyspora erythraea NRRL 2338]
MPETTTEKIRVAIHISDSLTRIGLTSFLAGDARITEAGKDDANVLVVAVKNVDSSTMTTLRDLRANTTALFLLLVEHRWNADIPTALELGVRAVLWRRDFNAKMFLQAIRTLGERGGFFPHSLQGALIDQVQRVYREVLAPQDLAMSGITNREIDVLRMVSEGFDLKHIAQELHFSERTVKNVLYNFTNRFNLHNRAHAVSYAIRSGLI